MSELLPCPFCGGEMKTDVVTFDVEFYEPPYEQWYLEHIDLDAAANEHCPIPTTDTFYETEAEAIEAWNTRAGCDNCAALNRAAGLWAKADKRARELERTCRIVKTWNDSDYVDGWRYRCSECGCFIPVDERDPETGDVISAANYCPNCGGKVVKSVENSD